MVGVASVGLGFPDLDHLPSIFSVHGFEVVTENPDRLVPGHTEFLGLPQLSLGLSEVTDSLLP